MRFPTLSKPQALGLALWSFGMVIARSCSLNAVADLLSPMLGQPYKTIRERLRDTYREAKAGEQRVELKWHPFLRVNSQGTFRREGWYITGSRFLTGCLPRAAAGTSNIANEVVGSGNTRAWMKVSRSYGFYTKTLVIIHRQEFFALLPMTRVALQMTFKGVNIFVAILPE
jgi:hypothetical protein